MKKLLLIIPISLLIFISWQFINKFQTQSLTDYGEFPVYPLTDLSGEPYNFEKKKIKLITFFYSRCPDICPLTLRDLTELYEELEHRGLLEEEVDILTITLDPEYDTVDVLKQYSQSYKTPKEHWYFLRGSDDNITSLTDELGYYREEIGGYWSHSTTIYLVDYENKKRTFHHMSTPNEPLDNEKIIRDIIVLKREHDRVRN